MQNPMQPLHQLGITTLVANARLGLHTLPDGLVDDFTDFEQLVEDNFDPRSSDWIDARARLQADKLTTKLMQAYPYSTLFVPYNDALIIEHLQPAMDRLLADFQADRKAAGRHANEAGVGIHMLEESDDIRAAIVRLHNIHPRYSALRASWQTLRRVDDTIDGLGLTSAISEVANIGEVVSNWDQAQHGRAPWPWTATVLHVKLGWLLDNGGQIWLPTASQQNDAWKHHNPQAKIAA